MRTIFCARRTGPMDRRYGIACVPLDRLERRRARADIPQLRPAAWPKGRVRQDGDMPLPPSTRSVKISDDERGGWSSDRPRTGGPERPVNVSGKCRILAPSDRMRYSPGSLLVIVSGSAPARERFADRLIEDRASLLSSGKVRGLLAGRVADDELEERAQQLLDAAIMKRLQVSETVVVVAESVDPAERERYIRMAFGLKRPRHLMFLEAPKDQVADEDLPLVNELRRTFDANEVGLEGFQTAMRLGGGAITELKRIIFRPPPPKED